MPKISNEALHAFNEGFDKCMQKLGNRRVGVDSTCLRKLVRENQEIVWRFVELYCVMAQSQPGYLQTVFIVATAYQIEFQDDTLVKMVMEQVDALGAGEHLRDISAAKTIDEAHADPPERTAAIAWWQSSDKTVGRCDNCSRPLRRGEGYLISGRAMMIGSMRVELGNELICQECFNRIR